jgi:uncharacterized protein (TIGR03435 family)
LLSVALLVAVLAGAQTTDGFEVASIKLTEAADGNTSFAYLPGGSLRIQGADLRSLIQYAYDLRDFQLAGASGWMTSEHYTILAKGEFAEGPSEYMKMNDQQRKAMFVLVRKRLQRLLAERFQLETHRETRQLPMYGLVVAKGGHKLTPNLSPDGSPQSMTRGQAMYKAKRASLESIAQGLAEITRHPVHNETGLQGFYDFEMKWTPDAAAAAPDSAEPRPAETAGPTLFTALQEQLGLKLESKKGPVEILVIDRAGRPSGN